MLNLVPIRYVNDVAACRDFYAGLELAIEPDAVLGTIWAQLAPDGAALGIHDVRASKGRPVGSFELAFVTDRDLEQLQEELFSKDYASTLHEEDYGRSLRVTDPDGVVVQIQQIDCARSEASLAEFSERP